MKLKSLISMMAAVAIVFAGCDKPLPEPENPKNPEQPTPEPEPEPIVGEITLQSAESLVFSDEGASQEVTFEATLEWTASASEDFVTVEPTSGAAGEAVVTVTVGANEAYDPRTATLTLTCGEDTKTIQLTQKQKGALLLTESTFSVAAEGGQVSIVAKANSNVTAAVAEDAQGWIAVATKALVDYAFEFVVAANESEQPRTGQIIFTNESGSETVTIEQAGAEPVPTETVFAAGFATETAAPFKTLWSNGDVVLVNGVASEALVLSDAAATADFTVGQVLEAPYSALYPASVLKAETTDVLALAEQAYVGEVSAEAILPVAAYQAEGTSLAFKQLLSLVKVTVTPDNQNNHKLDYAELSSASEKLHGEFTLDFAAATLAAKGETADAEKVIRCELDHELATADTLNLYFVLPAAEYSAGLTVNVADTEGHVMTYATEGAWTLEAGVVSEIAFALAHPQEQYNGQLEDVNDLIEFATLYNANEVDATVEVTLVNDIVFDETTSAAYAATGGIGVRSGDNAHYFNGVFNGNNKTIKGYTANIPLFAAIDTYGTVKDFTIDNTSSFTFDAAVLDEMGTVAGYHKGLMENVTVNADITFAAAEFSSAKQIGGLCARVREGQVKNSVYAGHIYVPATFSSTAARVYLGGITGWISNAEGLVTATDFRGSIDFEGHVSSTDKSNPYLMFGGIVGSNSGTVSDCEVFGDKTFTTSQGDYSYSTASLSNRSTLSYFSSEGGVAGVNAEGGKIQNCINRANFINFILRTGTDGTALDANSRYLFDGGIVGYNVGEVSGCTNYGFIFNRCTPRLQKLGGIVGRNEGTVTNCVNETSGTVSVGTIGSDSFSARLPYVGGVIGENVSADVSNVQNKAKLTISRIENSTSSEIRVGGVIGSNAAEIDGTSAMNISNSGNVVVENSIDKVTLGLFEGGVIGWTSASVKNVKNTGAVSHKNTTSLQKLYLSGVVGSVVSAANVEISGCENEGEIYFNAATASASGSVEYKENFVGGVLAGTTSNVTISSGKNAGYVHGGNATKLNGMTLYMGGVVGHLKGQSSIVSCENTGKIYNDTFNNSNAKELSVYAGGVAGFIEGTAENAITVTNCSVTTADKETELFGHRRGYSGGIVAYAEYATISECACDRNFNGSAYYLGGIAGWIVNSTISNCDWTGTSIISSQLQSAGGIVARLGAGSTVDGCRSYLETLAKGGTVAGISEAGATIKNCHYKTTSGLGVCSDANATQENNLADL